MAALRQPSPGARIASASEQDYDDVIALLEIAPLPTQDLRRGSMAHFVTARNASGRLIGAIGVEQYGRHALLRSLVVAPDHRNRGVAAGLVAELEARCISLTVAELFLLTTSAEGFFAGQGYSAVGRESVPAALRATAEFTRLCPDTAVCMFKSL